MYGFTGDSNRVMFQSFRGTYESTGSQSSLTTPKSKELRPESNFYYNKGPFNLTEVILKSRCLYKNSFWFSLGRDSWFPRPPTSY